MINGFHHCIHTKEWNSSKYMIHEFVKVSYSLWIYSGEKVESVALTFETKIAEFTSLKPCDRKIQSWTPTHFGIAIYRVTQIKEKIVFIEIRIFSFKDLLRCIYFSSSHPYIIIWWLASFSFTGSSLLYLMILWGTGISIN